jgi:hypothetical protein
MQKSPNGATGNSQACERLENVGGISPSPNGATGLSRPIGARRILFSLWSRRSHAWLLTPAPSGLSIGG